MPRCHIWAGLPPVVPGHLSSQGAKTSGRWNLGQHPFCCSEASDVFWRLHFDSESILPHLSHSLGVYAYQNFEEELHLGLNQ